MFELSVVTSRIRRRKVLAITAAVLLLTTGTAVASAATTGVGALAVSSKADRSNPRTLNASTLTGNAYIFLNRSNVNQVEFKLDGSQVSIERLAPYDLATTASDGSARALDTTKLSKGTHRVVAVVNTTNRGVRTFAATFNVDNSTSGGPSTTSAPATSSTTTPKPTTTTSAPSTSTTALPTTTVPTTTSSTTSTTAKPTTTTSTTSTTVVPPTTGTRTWPTAQSTGASGSLADVSGEVVLGAAGQVYENKRINGTLVVTACGVTVRNVEVNAGNNTGGDLHGIWLKQSENCTQPVVLDHVTVNALNFLTTGIRSAYGAPAQILSSKIIGSQDGVLGLGSGLLQDSYIQLGMVQFDSHNDGFQTGGSDGIVVRHNTILNPNGQTSALALFTEFGPNKNMRIENNLLAGGGYTCYCGDGATDNNGNSARAVNVDIVNNVFWKKYYPSVGAYGSGRDYNPAGGGEWTNNLFMNADGTLTTQLVPMPGIS